MPSAPPLAVGPDDVHVEPSLAALRQVLAEPARLGLAFQPIVDLRRGVVAGYEALARFDAEPRVTPDRWFVAAVRLGLAAELEALAVQRVLAARGRVPANCFLTVNVSPAALTTEPVLRAFAAAGDLAGLVVEITEQVQVTDYGELEAVVVSLRAAGATVAVDDAGAGYASLRHVTALRPEFVKIDRDLVADLHRDEARAAVVEMLGVFAGRIDAWVVAEGVEHREELRRLIELGVPLGQGYGLGRPAPEMRPLDERAAELSRDVRGQLEDQGVGALREVCPTLPAAATRGEIAHRFVVDARAQFVALVDPHGRPTALVDRERFARGGAPTAVTLVVEAASALAEVARRAMTRHSGDRFAPLCCCDERGRLLGIVRVERLVEALAR